MHSQRTEHANHASTGPDATVDAIIHARCIHCHAPDGEAEEHPFTTLERVRTARVPIASRVGARAMPPKGNTELTPKERDALLTWTKCMPTN